METVFIENYRGKDIFYSTRNEKFYADIDEGKERNLIHLVRKDIDEYIKANQNFKPFEAVNTYYLTPKFVTVTGVRKDKALQCTGGEQVSNYELGNSYSSKCTWFALNVDVKDSCLKGISNEESEIKTLEEKIKFHEEKIRGFIDKMKGENLADFRNRILGETKEEIN